MRECQIRQETVRGVEVLHLDGSLDSYSFPRLESSLNNLRASSHHLIVMDCAALDYINSAALGALIGFARRARENGGDVKLAALPPKVLNIIETLGFDRILHILPDIDQAVAKFSAPGK